LGRNEEELKKNRTERAVLLKRRVYREDEFLKI